MNQRGGTLVQNTKKRLVRLFDPNGPEIDSARQKVDAAYADYKDASIRRGLGESSGYNTSVEQLQAAHAEEGLARVRQAEHDARLRAYGLIGLSGVGVPTLAGVAGYQGVKAGGQNGNV